MNISERKQERGMLTVEATLALVPFLMVILGIISFINVYMVHNRIQYAIFQVGSELSAYTYFYQTLGIRDADGTLSDDIDMATSELEKTANSINSFLNSTVTAKEGYTKVLNSNMNDLEDNVNNAIEWTESAVESGKEAWEQSMYMAHNPEKILQGVVFDIIDKGVNALKSALTEVIAGHMIDIYIQQNNMSAQEYLSRFGVRDAELNLENSTMFSDDGHRMIDIVVEYDIEIYFFKLFLKDPYVHMVQRVVVPAWLNGDGSNYDG